MAFRENESQQISLFDHERWLTEREKKVLEKSWAKVFADEIFPAIDESRFRVLYSEKASRPNTPVTTTHRQLIRLKSGVMIIDTPGMRELGMWDVHEGLADAFLDVEQYLGQCRFSDCRHKTEPGCAIKAAIATGELDASRWESYQKLKEESIDREEMMRRRNEWAKGVAKYTKQRKKEIW